MPDPVIGDVDNEPERKVSKDEGILFPIHEVVMARSLRAFKMDDRKVEDTERDILEKERAITTAIREWKALGSGKTDPTTRELIEIRGEALLARIASLRSGVNTDITLLYHHFLRRRTIPPQTLGKGKYPDLYNSSCLVLMLQRIGIPVTDVDLAKACFREGDHGPISGSGLMNILDCFRELDLSGRWTSIGTGHTRDEIRIDMVGRDGPERASDLVSWIIRFLGKDQRSCHLSLSLGGPPDLRLMKSDQKGHIIMVPEMEQGDKESAEQTKTLKESDLARSFSENGYSLILKDVGGSMNMRKTALELLDQEKTSSRQVQITIDREGSKRDIIVDDFNLFARKMTAIDPSFPRGATKLRNWYGKDLDDQINHWSKTGHQMLSLSIDQIEK